MSSAAIQRWPTAPSRRDRFIPAVRHGPYAEWTRKIGGKTITRRLTPDQLAAWQPLFNNAKKLRALLAELQDLTLAIIEASETPATITGKPGKTPWPPPP